jgi:UDP-GlcNAc:undecaprenyl-phosphate GlcNAc-1-phosphate transferase
MRTYVTAFIIATILSAVLTPLVRKLALGIGAVSPSGGRHALHPTAVPRLGGIAIFVALIAPLVGLFFVESGVAIIIRDQSVQVEGLLLGGGLMGLVGFIDDTRGIRALHKFLAQLVAAGVAYAFGFRIDAISLPLFGDLQMGVFALPVTMLWITGIVNAVNLIDGLDGLAAGVVFFAGLTNFVVAHISGSVFVALIMASMLGALLGFLFYNFNPARIFMGDTGSYFLGYVLATTSLAGALQKESTAVSLLIPVVALGIPITDTLFAMVRRFVERRPIFSPDRGHIHHKLLDLGITHKRAVLIIHAMSIVLTLAAIGLALGRKWEVGLAILAASSVLIALIRFAGYSESLVRHPKSRRDRDAELLRQALQEAPAHLMRARSEVEIWEALEALIGRAKMGYVDLIENVVDGEEQRLLRKSAPDCPSDDRDFVFSRHTLGPEHAARYSLKFAWQSDVGSVSPKAEVLLELLSDFVAQHLVRLSSHFAPSARVEETESSRESGTSPVPGNAAHAKS